MDDHKHWLHDILMNFAMLMFNKYPEKTASQISVKDLQDSIKEFLNRINREK